MGMILNHIDSRMASLMLACFLILGTASALADGARESNGHAADTAAFTIDLYAQLAGAQDGNLFFSPVSIQTALAMPYAGAHGVTAEQMAKALHYQAPVDRLNEACAGFLHLLNDAPKDRPYQLIVANALWCQQGLALRPDFSQLVQKTYGAGLQPVDLVRAPDQACRTINDWAAKQTRDKIKDVIGRDILTPNTRLVLTNVVYFKSKWATEFAKGATVDGAFHLTADKSVETRLMNQTTALGYFESEDLQLVEMPYVKGPLSMIVLLPRKVDGLRGLEKTLTVEKVEGWLKGKKSEDVSVTLPKFTFDARCMLASTLQKMGMTEAFDQAKADFSGIAATPLYLSAIIHKAFVAVDEEGTEAAAATVVIGGTFGLGDIVGKTKTFRADHPFMFLILHNGTGKIMFAGRLVDPKTKG